MMERLHSGVVALLVLLLVLLLMTVEVAGAGEWALEYNGIVGSIQQTSDEGYIIGGWGSFGIGAEDAHILKLDANGNIEWDKAFGGVDYDFATLILEANDGGYIVAGDFGTGTPQCGSGTPCGAWILKLDRNGNIVWEKVYTKPNGAPFAIHSIEQTGDGEYIVAGNVIYQESEDSDVVSGILICKLDSEGNIQWQRAIVGGPTFPKAHQTSDGGYIILGSFVYANGTKLENQIFVLKLDSNGAIEWQKAYIERGYEATEDSIIETNDGGYIVVGHR